MQYRWLVVALTMLMQAVSYGILVYAFALFVVPWLTTFETTRTDIMLAVFALQIALGVFSPFAGRMLDHYSASWLVPLGGVLLASGLALASYATTWWQITVLYATLLPAAATLTGPLAAQTIITKWFTENRGFAIGVSAVGTSIGGFLVPILCSVLLTEFDWRTTILYLAFLALFIICPFSWLVLRRKPPDTSYLAPSLARKASVSTDQRIWATSEIIRTRDFWLPAIAFLALGMAFSGIQFNLAPLAQDLNNSLRQSAWLLSLLSLSMIIGKLCFGFMSDRVDHRKLYWLATIFMCITLVLMRGKPSYSVLCLGSVMLGLSIGGWLPLMGAIYSQRFGARSFGRVMGLVTLVVTLGGIGPLIAGAAFDATGSYDGAFLFFLVVLIPAALGMIALKRHVVEDASPARVVELNPKSN